MSSVMAGVDRLTRIAGQNRVELLLFQLGPSQTFGRAYRQFALGRDSPPADRYRQQ